MDRTVEYFGFFLRLRIVLGNPVFGFGPRAIELFSVAVSASSDEHHLAIRDWSGIEASAQVGLLFPRILINNLLAQLEDSLRLRGRSQGNKKEDSIPSRGRHVNNVISSRLKLEESRVTQATR